MKRIILCIVLGGFCSTISAQLRKGQWLVGGMGSYIHAKNSTDLPGGSVNLKQNTIEASPGAGYFFMDRVCGGLRAIVSYNKQSTAADAQIPGGGFSTASESKSTGIGASPFIRYYFLPATKKVNILADVSYSYTHHNEKVSGTQVDFNSSPGGQPQVSGYSSKQAFNLNSYAVEAGPAFFLNPNVSLELTVGYVYSSASKSEMDVNSFIAGFGFQVHLGK